MTPAVAEILKRHERWTFCARVKDGKFVIELSDGALEATSVIGFKAVEQAGWDIAAQQLRHMENHLLLSAGRPSDNSE